MLVFLSLIRALRHQLEHAALQRRVYGHKRQGSTKKKPLRDLRLSG